MCRCIKCKLTNLQNSQKIGPRTKFSPDSWTTAKAIDHFIPNPQKIRIITPYNKTLNNATKQEYEQWKQMVLQQLQKLGITGEEEVTMLCGKNYYKGLLSYFKNVNLPLEQFKGMGYQISFMKNNTKPKGSLL